MKRGLLMLLVCLGVVGIGLYVLLIPENARGTDCGGRPLTIVGRGPSAEAVRIGLQSDCHESAVESVALGFTVIGLGLIMCVVTVAGTRVPKEG